MIEEMRLEYINPAEIKWCEDARKNETTVKMLIQSFEDFGFISPILITPNLELISGSGRIKASLKAGLKKIPCVVVDEITREQAKAFRFVDNHISECSGWDYFEKKKQIESLKFKVHEYGLPEHILPRVDIDEFFEPGTESQVSLFDMMGGDFD